MILIGDVTKPHPLIDSDFRFQIWPISVSHFSKFRFTAIAIFSGFGGLLTIELFLGHKKWMC